MINKLLQLHTVTIRLPQVHQLPPRCQFFLSPGFQTRYLPCHHSLSPHTTASTSRETRHVVGLCRSWSYTFLYQQFVWVRAIDNLITCIPFKFKAPSTSIIHCMYIKIDIYLYKYILQYRHTVNINIYICIYIYSKYIYYRSCIHIYCAHV